MDLDAYVAEHAGEWRRLEQLSRRRKLSAPEVDELLALYQRTATHLSVIRSRSPDPALVAQLSRIVLAGRSAITGGPSFSWRGVLRFATTSFPLEVYRARRWWIGVGVAFVGLTAAIIGYMVANPAVERAFFSPEKIDEIVNSDFAGYYTEFQAQNFAFLVWTHNAFISALCLAAGVLIVPTLYMLAGNVLNVGLTGGVMVAHGRSDVFFGLILPHGMLELTTLFVASGVGLRIGWAWIAPGPDRTRGRALAEAVRSAMVVALGLVGPLAVSGFIEAFVTPSGWPTVLRIGVGFVAWVAFLAYTLGLGSRAAHAGESADVDEALRGAEVPAV